MSIPKYADLPGVTHAEAYTILSRLNDNMKQLQPVQQTMALRLFEKKLPARFKFERMRYHYPNLYFDHNEV